MSQTTDSNLYLDDVCDISGDVGLSTLAMGVPSEKLLQQIPALDHRATDLVCVRESDESDHILMEGCIQHTLSHCSALPGHQQASELGIAPLSSPGDFSGMFPVLELRHRRSRAVLFLLGSTYFLYSEGSAAKTNVDGENNFTMMLLAVLERLRPVNVHIVALSRLVRSFEHAGLVQSAITRHVDRVFHAGMPMTMRGQGQEVGQLMWSTLASISASERNLIVQRLTAGVVAKYNRGHWTIGKHAVPYGYRLVDGVLTVDESQRDAMAVAWSLLARKMPPRRVVQELADFGLSTPHLRRKHGPDATVALMRNPINFVDRMLRYAPLYLTGTHTQLLANPFPGAPHLASLPVKPPTPERPNGHVEFEFSPGVPDGGWIDPDVIHQALRLRRDDPRKSYLSAEGTPPLRGTAWIDDGLHFRIYGSPGGQYDIRAIPMSQAGMP
jgi:hypothetical protein